MSANIPVFTLCQVPAKRSKHNFKDNYISKTVTWWKPGHKKRKGAWGWHHVRCILEAESKRWTSRSLWTFHYPRILHYPSILLSLQASLPKTLGRKAAIQSDIGGNSPLIERAKPAEIGQNKHSRAALTDEFRRHLGNHSMCTLRTSTHGRILL